MFRCVPCQTQRNYNPSLHRLVFSESSVPESLGWGPGLGRSHNAQWSWVLRSAGRSTEIRCASPCPLSPPAAGRVYLWQTSDVKQDSLPAACLCDELTYSALHWCWSAPWSLTSVRFPLWCAAMSCWPYQPVSQSPPSPPGTGLERLETGRKVSGANSFFLFCHAALAGEWTEAHPKVCLHYSSVNGQ